MIFKLFVSWVFFSPKMFLKITMEANFRAHFYQQLFINLKSPCGKMISMNVVLSFNFSIFLMYDQKENPIYFSLLIYICPTVHPRLDPAPWLSAWL